MIKNKMQLVNENQVCIQAAAGVLFHEGYNRYALKEVVTKRARVILMNQFQFGKELASILSPYVVWYLYKIEFFHKEFNELMGL